jgi:hypothetical protein
MDAGADPDASDKQGNTPRMLAQTSQAGLGMFAELRWTAVKQLLEREIQNLAQRDA